MGPVPVRPLEPGYDASDKHATWMEEALRLAQAMQGRVWPNPAVGCVIVRNETIVGRGQTQPGGRPHAERVALNNARQLARGATLYVTLEPCSHWGRTPPCADAIIAAGICSVHAALQDPDPRVNGGGFAKLREAGVAVHIGLGAAAARETLAGFFMRISSGRPLVTVDDCVIAPGDAVSIPNMFDALVMAEGEQTIVATRDKNGQAEVLQLPGHLAPSEAAQALGKMGLTSIAIPAANPLALSWRAAGLADRVISCKANEAVNRQPDSATLHTGRHSSLPKTVFSKRS